MVASNAPNFLVVGTQKAGTTYLCDKLASHPDIYFSPKKEPMFFQRRFSKEGFKAYLSGQFGGAGGQPWRGEGSTVYFQTPKALTNIERHLGSDLKIMVCLRHPTEKAVSHFLHQWRRGRFPRPIDINNAPAFAHGLSPQRTAMYYRHMCRWLSAYGKRQIEVLLFDKLKADPNAYTAQALGFLGLEPTAEVDPEPLNKGTGLVWKGDTLTIQDNPGNKWKPAFKKAELMRLHESYIQDIERLEDLLHLGISHWKEFPQFTSAPRQTTDLLASFRDRVSTGIARIFVPTKSINSGSTVPAPQQLPIESS